MLNCAKNDAQVSYFIFEKKKFSSFINFDFVYFFLNVWEEFSIAQAWVSLMFIRGFHMFLAEFLKFYQIGKKTVARLYKENLKNFFIKSSWLEGTKDSKGAFR